MGACGSAHPEPAADVLGTVEYKVGLTGKPGAGKSALIFRFIENKFVEEYDPTIEDDYRKEVKLGSRSFVLDLIDAGGNEFTDDWYKKSQGFILVYAQNDRSSLDDIKDRLAKITSLMGDVPAVVCGTKSDLADEGVVADAKSFASAHGLPHIGSSQKTGTNYERVFESIVEQCRKKIHS